jgi:signal peptidase I
MAEAITPETDAEKPMEPRRLYPGLAFLGGLIGLGLGYVYVGRIAYAIGFLVAAYLYLFMAGWTRMAMNPVGWYTMFAISGLCWLVQLVHPMAIASSQPLAPPKPYNRWWWYAAWTVGINVVLWPVSANRGAAFGYDNYYIRSGSMEPTVQAGDRILVDAWRYRDTPPAFGDIVVCEIAEVRVVKRVVGVPGDTIELRGAQLVRNGRVVQEPYVNLERLSNTPNAGPLTLGAEEFFVLGDNRGNSNDSRYVGPLARDQIFGRVEFVYFSRSAGGGVNWQRFPVMLASD